MARRSRKPRPGASAPARAAPSPARRDALRRGYARAEERNAAARATLTPLAPGERPRPLIVAAAVAALLATANLVLLIVGLDVEGSEPGAAGVLVFCAVMYAAAAGMWARQYWAVLGFQALLGLTIVVFALFLLRASNLAAVVLCVVVCGGAGWLFWKLVRVLGRMQAPQRGTPQGGRS